MSGLVKQKNYDWKDSNLALFGSDTERQVKKASAETEPAWKKAGDEVGLQIWRIVKFKVTHWPKEDYGKFYDGDSYIILNTFKEDGGDELLYDVHFWIGKHSTADEYGTAAYKTVELDTLLDDKPIQHREVQGHESDMFRSYFRTITYIRGGADSGFRHVKPAEYKPKLFHFCGDKHKVVVKEIPRRKKLDSGDVYILDLGLTIYQWNGQGSNKDERIRAAQYLTKLKDERYGKAKAEVLEETDVEEDHEFQRFLDGGEEEEEDDDIPSMDQSQGGEKKLFRVSDASGKLDMKLEKSGSIDRGDFDTNDVFIYDTPKNLFVWIGKQTSTAEKQNAMTYAHNYLMKSSHPFIPVTCLAEGKKHREFDTALAA